MKQEERKLIRAIIRQVHPDLFASNPYERQRNSDSLKNLNTYVDELSQSYRPIPVRLEFYVKDDNNLRKIDAQLTASGSLSPLFYAFGLISAEELAASASTSSDTNFLLWLREQVQEAVRTAEQHDALKQLIRRMKSTMEERFSLAAIQVGAEYAVSLSEQERQIEALKVLEGALATLSNDDGVSFEGLSIQLYHPSSCPLDSYSFMDDQGQPNMRTSHMKSHVSDDGSVHVVADRTTIKSQITTLDLERGRTLTKVAFFWVKRVRELTPIVTELLRVRSVWCDTKNAQASQKFVIWAGYLLEQREKVEAELRGRKFSFSIIVHCDQQAPLINFHQSSPILNVRSDCPPAHLLEFLVSETGSQASDIASEMQNSRAREEALLEKVRQVFEAKCVIKICMNEKVVEGAKRLLENAEVIKAAVNLKGACLALDDCYEVWDSGFISIPYDFQIQELSQMVRLLQSGQRPPPPGTTNPTVASLNSERSKVAAQAVGGITRQQRLVPASSTTASSGALAVRRSIVPGPHRLAPRSVAARSRPSLTVAKASRAVLRV